MSPSVQMAVASSFLIVTMVLTFLLLHRGASSFSTRKIARLGVLLSLALIFGVLESFLPTAFLPGFRLGLANVAIVLVLYLYGAKDGLIVALSKAVLVSILRGSVFSMGGAMALAGTLLSFLGMALLHALIKKMSVIGISLSGALLHVLGQIAVAYLFLGSPILGYLPWLLLLSFGTGIGVGLICYAILRRTKFVTRFRS